MVQRRLQGGEDGVKMYKSTVHCAYHTVSKKCVYCTIFLGDQELLVFFLGGKVSFVFFLAEDSLVSMIANMHMCAPGEEYSCGEMIVFHNSTGFQNKNI